MANNMRNIGWKLWVQWVLAYVIGVALATKLAMEFYNVGSGSIGHAVMGSIGAILYGLIIGVAQWLILFRFGIPAWWILATWIGSFMFYSTGSLLGAAIVQWPILWRRTQWSGLWVLAYLPTYLLLTRKINTLYFSISPLLSNSNFETSFIVSIIISGIDAIITGLVLIWLLHHPKLKN